MRNVTEILADAANASHGSVSERILTVAKELASEGRFADLGEVLDLFMPMYPETRHFVKAHLRGVILNNYLLPTSGISTSNLLKWEKDQKPTWGADISASAADSKQLPLLVTHLEQSMREFQAKHP